MTNENTAAALMECLPGHRRTRPDKPTIRMATLTIEQATRNLAAAAALEYELACDPEAAAKIAGAL